MKVKKEGKGNIKELKRKGTEVGMSKGKEIQVERGQKRR